MKTEVHMAYRDSTIPSEHKWANYKEAKRAVSVHSIGEVSISENGTEVALPDRIDTINLSDLAKRYKLKWPDSTYGHADKDHPLQMFVQAEIRRRLYEYIQDIVERNHVLTLWKMQDVVQHSSRWRVIGGVEDGHVWAFLVTEFAAWMTGEDPFWESLVLGVEANDGYVHTMHEMPHVDCYFPPRGVPGEQKTDRAVGPDRPNDFMYTGPDHGRMERQVECLWPVKGKTLDELKALIARLEPVTQDWWQAHGVGVL